MRHAMAIYVLLMRVGKMSFCTRPDFVSIEVPKEVEHAMLHAS